MPPSQSPPRAIVIAPASDNPAGTDPALLRAGGLSLLVRALLALRRAGVQDLTVVAEGPKDPLAEEVRREPRLGAIRLLTPAEAKDAAALSGGDFLLVSADRVFPPETVEDLLLAESPDGGSVSLTGEDGRFAGLARCRASLAGAVADVLGAPGDPAGRLERALAPTVRLPLRKGFIEPARSAAEARQAESRLLKTLTKDTDSFLARTIDRHISLAFTRRLARTRVTPNQVTLINFFVGLAGAALFAEPDRGLQTLGALIFLFSSAVDGVDGEIARLTFRQSRLGGWLDLWVDNLVHVAVFAAIAVGLHRQAPAERFLWLGAFSCLGVLLSAGMVSSKILRRKSGEGSFFVSVGEGIAEEGKPGDAARRPRKDWIRRLDDYLARRDFIYFLPPLAAFGWLEWFLWASAVGGNLFFLSLLVLYRRAETA